MIAHKEIINEMGKWRKITNRQGYSMQEIAFAWLLDKGIIGKSIQPLHGIVRERAAGQ